MRAAAASAVGWVCVGVVGVGGDWAAFVDDTVGGWQAFNIPMTVCNMT